MTTDGKRTAKRNATMTQREHMRRTWARWGYGVSAMAVVLSAVGCGASTGGAEEGSPEEFVRVINVQTRALEPQQFSDEIRLTSVAMANQDVYLAAEESGVIRAIYADRGSRVSQGDSIAKIDDRVLAAQVAQVLVGRVVLDHVEVDRDVARLVAVDEVHHLPHHLVVDVVVERAQ